MGVCRRPRAHWQQPSCQADPSFPARPRTTKLTYIYEFGDGWQHQLTLTKPRAADPNLAYPRYITGEHAASPEDCGGILGFYAQLEISAIPIIPITKTLRIGLATVIPAASTNRPSRTGSPGIANRRRTASTRTKQC